MQTVTGRWPLVGRAAELARFDQALRDKHCQGWVVCGPAGAGKSRLALECLERAGARKYRTIRVSATKESAAVPLGALAQILPQGLDLSDPAGGFEAVARALSDVGPTALLVDDAQYIDAASAALVSHLLDAGSVFLIATVRTGEPLGKAVTALLHRGDSVARSDLTTLSRDQVEELLIKVFGAPFGRRTVHLLHETSGGNVLYLRELVLGAVAHGRLTHDEVYEIAVESGTPTPRLRELIEDKLAAAGPSARPVLDTLAWCGALSLKALEPLATYEALCGMEEAGIIQLSLDGPRTSVSLAHPIYGEILRSTTPALRRRELLLRQAEFIESHGSRRRADPLNVASWRLAATGTADPVLLLQAAVTALHSYDSEQAVTLLRSRREEDRTTASSTLLGKALANLGRFSEAEVLLAEAGARATAEPERLAVLLARVVNFYWWDRREDAAALLSRASAEFSDAEEVRGQLRIAEGALLVVSGRPGQGVPKLEALPESPEGPHDVEQWLVIANVKATGLTMVGRTEEALRLIRHVLATHEGINLGGLLPHPSVHTGPYVQALSERGRFAEARRRSEEAAAALSSANSPVARQWLASTLARVEWLAGHPVDARQCYAEAVALARSVQHAPDLQVLLSGLAASAALLGDHREAAEALRAMAECKRSTYLSGERHLGEAWLHAAKGETQQAREVLGQAAAEARRTEHAISEVLLLTDIARLGGAREVIGRLTELRDIVDSPFTAARVTFAEALAGGAPEALARVSEELEAMGADLLAAEAACAAADAWAKAAEQRRATAAAVHADDLVARCQGARTPILLTSTQEVTPLTGREKEIALLAARGHSSRAIAEQLVLSVRTIDNHLQNVYGKLGLSGRSDLARLLDS